MILKSILAGIFISIGSFIFVKLGGGIAAALLFSIGLLGIFTLELKLYTGYIGFIFNTPHILNNIKTALIILFGNLIGSCILLPYKNDYAITLIQNKLSTPLQISFINAIICGILIYTAVQAWKQNNTLIVILSVAAFILFGAEHSIADLCYFMCAKYFTFEFIPFIIIVIIGNAIGSIVTNYICDKRRIAYALRRDNKE